MQMQARNTRGLEKKNNNLFTRARKEENEENSLNRRTNVSTDAFHRTARAHFIEHLIGKQKWRAQT
jgi:hypothetical protein